ncbi:hypothetical protein L8C07_06110 [Paenibacillus sp. CMAA1739]|uniref:hypothetical protein n=1 Tax=Paenibacillus ottowii TaxID=2315729 RepID=UPI002DB667F6|nr:hypothetical protein [Paenibacillus sp. CMAA1739]MEC4565514.1 hypothetical protein [Paenibacillus sp. CMAA1739]
MNTEFITECVCLNPKYRSVTIKHPSTKILMDSGAFQDTDKNNRVSYEKALERQLSLEKKVGIISERIVAYDHIGNVEETIRANKYLVSKRDDLKPRQLVLMVQGITTRDYIYCLTETLKIATPEDCIGLGGVAMSGRVNDAKNKLLDAIKIGLPVIYNSHIKDIHIFGVGTFRVLKEVSNIKDILRLTGIQVDELNISCDTSAFEVMSTMGNVVDEEQEKWIKLFTKDQKYIDYHPVDLMQSNIRKAAKIIDSI